MNQKDIKRQVEELVLQAFLSILAKLADEIKAMKDYQDMKF